MILTDLEIANALPREKSYKLSDGKGMYVLVHPNGGKYFRVDYRFNAKRKTLALGVYPHVNLDTARTKLVTIKQLLKTGIDPSIRSTPSSLSNQNTSDNLNIALQEYSNDELINELRRRGITIVSVTDHCLEIDTRSVEHALSEFLYGS